MLSSINGTLARSEEGSKVLRDLRYRIITRNIEHKTKTTEMELCEQYNVSRTPARQIIQQLTNEGLLVPLDNGCKCTIDFGERDLDDLYALRNYYEHEAVDTIFTSGTRTLAVLSDLILFVEGNKNKSVEETLISDIDFHRMIVRQSGNKFLSRGYDAIAPILYTLFRIGSEYYGEDFTSDFYTEHITLVQNLLVYDHNECLKEFGEHNRWAENKVKEAYYSIVGL